MNTNINDDIITKYLCGEASPEEAISLENWKASSPQNKAYFDNMEQTFMLVSGIEIAVSDPQKVWEKINPDVPVKITRFRWIYGIAAVFLTGMVAVIFLINIKNKHASEFYASDKTVQKTLNDHSIITLQKNGFVTLNKDYGKTNRKLTLKGKAEFKVVHNEKLPFIIESQGVFIEDLGTIFTVESEPDSDTVYVVVNEGIVRLYDEHGSEIIIKAGEKAWYIRSQKQIITSLDTKVLKFDFKDTKLSDAVTLLSETYNVNIKLQPDGIGNCRITTQFFDEEIATIITIIAETLGFQYECQNHQYIINGQPCK